jgi:mannose-6-phosphate isomerase-like protein (cupin superfamily)
VTYLGERGEAAATVRSDIEPLVVSPDNGTTATFVAPGSVTRREFGLFRWDMPAGAGGAGKHFHRGFSESFYVISGTVTLYTAMNDSKSQRAASFTCRLGASMPSATTPMRPPRCSSCSHPA